MTDGFHSVSQEKFDVSSPNLVHWSTKTRRKPSSNGMTLTSFSRLQRSHSRLRHMKDCVQDGFRSISEEIFDISSPNMIHRSTNARQRPSLNWETLTSFSRSQRSFKTMAHEIWFSLNIWRKIWRILTKFGTQNYQGKTKTKFELGELDLIFNVTEVI